MKSYYFTEEHELFRQSLRGFLDREVMPNIDHWEEVQQIPREVWKKMGDLGFLGLSYPEKYGGMALDFFYDVVFCEEISKCFSGGFAVTQMVVQYMSGPYILKHGSDFLKQKYLPKIISGEWISSIAITEPGAGSDAANIQTTAIREGEHYIVNGSKTFITNGVYGDFLVAVVKTNPQAGAAGVSLLIIDRHSPGITATKLKKLGWHSSDTAELSFDQVKVPVENLIGEEGQGFYYLMGGLQIERLTGSVGAYAGCESALQYALEYMAARKAFGRTINKFQVLRHRVAQLAAELESVKQFVLYCARRHNEGDYIVKECSMAKLLSTELSDKTAYECLQFLGGYGYMEEYKMARMFRDSRILTIGGGTSEIMREIIAKMVIDDIHYQPATTGDSLAMHTNGQTSTLDKLAANIQSLAGKAAPLGHTLKFDFGSEQLMIDGTGTSNIVSTTDQIADCAVSISREDFQALMTGSLDPMSAFMTGKIKISGNMNVAMKLQALFQP